MGKRTKKAKTSIAPTHPEPTAAAKSHWDSLSPPNHNLLLSRRGETSATADATPLLRLSVCDGDKGARPVFFDRRYGLEHWSDRDPSVPPSWIDPEILAEMVLRDMRFSLLSRVLIRQDPVPVPSRLLDVIRDVYNAQYVPYAQCRLEEALQPFAEWLLAYAASRVVEGGHHNGGASVSEGRSVG
jgi:hypothetical protein